MRLREERIGDVVVLTPATDRIGAEVAESLKEQLHRHIDRTSRLVVLDLAEVGFVDSAGLGVIVSALKKARSEGGDVAVTGLRDTVRSLFKLTRMDKVFRLFDSREAAAAALSG
jgi:anti-sigma B factor antagonist